MPKFSGAFKTRQEAMNWYPAGTEIIKAKDKQDRIWYIAENWYLRRKFGLVEVK